MQTYRQSRFEVGADFGVSLLINLVTQFLFYGALATAGRSLAFASLVLGDGRVLIEGGEYNSGAFVLTNKGAIYDPKTNTWTSVAPPTGWTTIGDSPSVVLPNGLFLLGTR